MGINIKRSKQKTELHAFTMVEVAFVIAITTIMAVAFAVTIASRVGSQRYKDSTTSFADFIRSVYSEVINVENTRSGQIKSQNDYCTLAGKAAAISASVAANVNPDESYPGRSGCAIYGKLISFGENDKNTIYVYDVIGRISDFLNPILVGNNTAIEELNMVNADVLALVPSKTNASLVSLETAANYGTYDPTWGARAENPDGSAFHGSLMIVRAPSSGAVRTYFLNRTLPYHDFIDNIDYRNISDSNPSAQQVITAVSNAKADLSQYLHNSTDANSGFVFQDVNICVNSDDLFAGISIRNNIRIKSDGHNATAVEFVESDKDPSAGGNVCKK